MGAETNYSVYTFFSGHGRTSGGSGGGGAAAVDRGPVAALPAPSGRGLAGVRVSKISKN